MRPDSESKQKKKTKKNKQTTTKLGEYAIVLAVSLLYLGPGGKTTIQCCLRRRIGEGRKAGRTSCCQVQPLPAIPHIHERLQSQPECCCPSMGAAVLGLSGQQHNQKSFCSCCNNSTLLCRATLTATQLCIYSLAKSKEHGAQDSELERKWLARNNEKGIS
jgi:hypothetical protein